MCDKEYSVIIFDKIFFFFFFSNFVSFIFIANLYTNLLHVSIIFIISRWIFRYMTNTQRHCILHESLQNVRYYRKKKRKIYVRETERCESQ